MPNDALREKITEELEKWIADKVDAWRVAGTVLALAASEPEREPDFVLLDGKVYEPGHGAYQQWLHDSVPGVRESGIPVWRAHTPEPAGGGCPHLHQDERGTDDGPRWHCLDCGAWSQHAGFRVGETPGDAEAARLAEQVIAIDRLYEELLETGDHMARHLLEQTLERAVAAARLLRTGGARTQGEP